MGWPFFDLSTQPARWIPRPQVQNTGGQKIVGADLSTLLPGTCSLVAQSPSKRQYYHAESNAVNNENLEGSVLEVPNQNGDDQIADQSRDDDSNDKRKAHLGRQARMANLQQLLERCPGDDGSGEQKREPRGCLPRHPPEQSCCHGDS